MSKPNPHPDLARQVKDRLQTGGACEVDVAAGGSRFRCRVSEVDAIGCAVDRIDVQRPDLPGADGQQIGRIAGHLGQKVQYLLEPLQLLELDAPAATAVLRSAKPWRDGDSREYYEMIVAPGGCRWSAIGKFPISPAPRRP